MIKAMQADVKVGRQKGHGKGAKLALTVGLNAEQSIGIEPKGRYFS